MKISRIKLTILFFVFITAMFARADVILLKGGQKLIGDIAAERHDKIYVDIGISVIAVPKEDILEYHYEKGADINGFTIQPIMEANQIIPESAIRLYYTGQLQNKTIEQCVSEVGEAVVKVSSPAGLGSGFFINEQGYLITNYHVVEKETKIEVTVFKKARDGFDKKVFKSVRIEAINPFLDLALLKVEDFGDSKIKFAYLGDIEEVKTGQPVFAIGNPMGLERTVTTGVISTTNRALEGLIYLQTDTAINPGNSGGPLFNQAGEVIGVTNMGYVFLGGLGFAIPIDYVKHFIDNRGSFAYDKDNPNTGFRYIQPDGRRNKGKPKIIEEKPR